MTQKWAHIAYGRTASKDYRLIAVPKSTDKEIYKAFNEIHSDTHQNKFREIRDQINKVDQPKGFLYMGFNGKNWFVSRNSVATHYDSSFPYMDRVGRPIGLAHGFVSEGNEFPVEIPDLSQEHIADLHRDTVLPIWETDTTSVSTRNQNFSRTQNITDIFPEEAIERMKQAVQTGESALVRVDTGTGKWVDISKSYQKEVPYHIPEKPIVIPDITLNSSLSKNEMSNKERVAQLKSIIQPWFIENLMKDEEFPLNALGNKKGVSYLEALHQHKGYTIEQGYASQPLDTIRSRGGYGRTENNESLKRNDETSLAVRGAIELIFGAPSLSKEEFLALKNTDYASIRAKADHTNRSSRSEAEINAIEALREALQKGLLDGIDFPDFQKLNKQALTEIQKAGTIKVDDETFAEKLKKWEITSQQKSVEEPSHSTAQEEKERNKAGGYHNLGKLAGGIALAAGGAVMLNNEKKKEPGEKPEKKTSWKKFAAVTSVIAGAALVGWAAYTKFGPTSSRQNIQR